MWLLSSARKATAGLTSSDFTAESWSSSFGDDVDHAGELAQAQACGRARERGEAIDAEAAAMTAPAAVSSQKWLAVAIGASRQAVFPSGPLVKLSRVHDGLFQDELGVPSGGPGSQ